MIDTKELRIRVEEDGKGGIDLEEIHELLDRLEAAESDAIEQARLNGMGASREAVLMAKLEAAEKDIALKERIIDSLGSELNAVANERDALRAELADLRSSMTFRTSLIGRIEAERNALRAKVEAMEKQEPVAWMLNCQTLGGDTGWILSWTQSGAGLCNRLQGEENEKRLFTLPGAQGEEK